MVRFAPVCLFAASVAFAQGNPSPAPEKSAPAAEDPIAVAKREFNVIKSSRGSLEQPAKLDLPSLSTPELQVGSSMTSLPSESKVDPRAAKKSENWLVDAMMKPNEKDARDPRARLANPAKREALDSTSGAKDPRADTDLPLDSRETPVVKDSTSPALAEKRTGPEFNPLQSYMSGWMTPKDYALLKPGLDGAAASSLPSRGDPSLPAVGGDLSVLGDTGSALDLTPTSKGAPFELPKLADNPFIQSSGGGGTPAMPAFTVPVAPSSGPMNTTIAPPAIDTTPTKSRIPDFAKPAMDEKYFKQLKRF